MGKELHELSREEFFNDTDHVRSSMPDKHEIHFKYPTGTGKFGKGKFTSDAAHKRGDAVSYGVVRGATVTASKQFKPNYNNLEMFEHGKKVHREAVEKAHKEGKHIPSHVLADYPHLSSQHSEDSHAHFQGVRSPVLNALVKAHSGSIHKPLVHSGSSPSMHSFSIPHDNTAKFHDDAKKVGLSAGKHYSFLGKSGHKDVAPTAHFDEQHSEEESEQFKEAHEIGHVPGQGTYYLHKHGNDANGNHSVWVSKGANRAFKIQTNQNLPKTHHNRVSKHHSILNDETKSEILAHLKSSQHEEQPEEEVETSLNLHPSMATFGSAVLMKPEKQETTQHAEKDKLVAGRSAFLSQKGRRGVNQRFHKILKQHGGAVHNAHGGFTLPKRAIESFNQAAAGAGFQHGHHFSLKG